jgi:phospholipase DDHD2
MSLEYFYEMDKTTTVLIPTDGGRYDVDIPKRIKIPVYWKDGLNDEMEVRRSSWFFKNGVNTWVPYDESLSTHLEEEYQSCVQSGQWKREIRLKDTNEAIRMITPNMMFHLPSEQSSITGKLDEWGQVQPPSQDPSLVPREVHRGIEGIIDDIPDGEDMACDHLVFVIHGIGAACDTKFRPIHEVVDSYRDLTHAMSKKHFQNAHLTEQVSRVEFLPVNWHTTLHGKNTISIHESESS